MADSRKRKNRVPLTVSIDPDLKEDVGFIAREENTSVSRIVENQLRDYRSTHPLFQEQAKTA